MDSNKVLADSTAAAQSAAKMLGGTFTQGVGAKGTTGPLKNDNSGQSSALMSEVEKRLLSAADGISSSSSNIENVISGASDAVRKSGEASASRINTDYNYEKQFMTGQAQAQLDNFSDSRGGFSTQFAALRNLTDSTAKDLRDLDQRRQDALMSNDASVASEISKMQMEKLKFEQDAKQNYFNSILGLGNFAQGEQELGMRKQENAFNQEMSLTKEARESSYDSWKRKFDEEKMTFDKSTTLFEQQQSQIRTNIMSRELKIKEAGSGLGLNADPGFATVQIQNEVGNMANGKLSAITKQIADGSLKEGTPAHSAATTQAYLDMRRVLSTSQVSNDALAKTLGLTFNTDGELSMIGAEDNSLPLPGDNNSEGFSNISFFQWLPGANQYNPLKYY